MRRDQQLLTVLLNLIRGVLLAAAVCGVGTAGIWYWRSDLILELERSIHHRHVHGANRDVLQAMQSLREEGNNSRAIADLERLLADLEYVLRGDRLFEFKLWAVGLLTDTLAERGEWERAVDWCDRWVEWDPNDINARIARTTAYANIPAKNSVAETELAALFQRIPESEIVAAAWIDFLVEANRPVEAFRAINQCLQSRSNRFLGESRLQFHDGTQVSNQKVSPYAQPNGRWRWTGVVAPGVAKVYFHIPTFEHATYRTIGLTGWNAQTDEAFAIPTSELDLNEAIRLEGDAWTILPADPDISWTESNAVWRWDVPDRLREHEFRLSFEAEIVLRYPIWIRELFSKPKFLIATESGLLQSQDDPSIVDAFRAMRLEILRQSPIVVSWPGSVFRLEQRAPIGGTIRDDDIDFDLSIPVDASFSNFQIELPNVVAANYSLTSVELVSQGETIAIDPGKLQPSRLSSGKGADQNQSDLRKPVSHSFALPDGNAHIDAIRIEGMVQ